MKKINRKRLNNKGFTLIELLAVVVILAVVMGIAMSSVLSSMNSSRKGSLQNSAESTAQIFQNKYAEAMVTGGADAVFNEYDFAGSGVKFYPLSEDIAADLNLSTKSYILGAKTEGKTAGADPTGDAYSATASFIAFDGNSFVVCLMAQPSGSYYVGNAASTDPATVFGTTVTFNDGDTTVMYACSNETASWE